MTSLLTLAVLAATAHARPPNILYLMSDDMRPQLGAYGQAYMKTPHLDRLSASGLQFDFAYSNFAYCAPSRNSFLSGRRPDRTRVLNFAYSFRETGGENWTAMPEFFKKKGYFTSSAGKIFQDDQDDAASWSYPSKQGEWIFCQPGDIRDEHNNFCGVTNASRRPYTDEDLILEQGLNRMTLAHASGKPWWVSIGVHRPHWSYRVPQGFHGPELYPDGQNDIVKPPAHPQAPLGVPWMSGNWANQEQDQDINDTALGCQTCTVPSSRAVEYRRWYYAAVTWADHCLGKALTKLEELGTVQNTIVIFHSDHGYQLGEGNEWSKKTNTELAVHIPLLIRVPWKEKSIGKRTTVKAELVDIYRTVVDLAGFSDVEEGVQGTSLAAVFDEPGRPPTTLAMKAAFSQIPRCGCHAGYKRNSTQCGLNVCMGVHSDSPQFNFMGYTMRTNRWRFTAWVPWSSLLRRADWSRFHTEGAAELFDLQDDTGRDFDFIGYSVNLALEPQYAPVVHELQQQLIAAVNSWPSIQYVNTTFI